MKALTVRQPYASRIAHGDKRVENRTRPTFYRGPVFIHAGVAPHAWWKNLDTLDIAELPLGAIVGEANIIGSHSAHGCVRDSCRLFGGMFPGTTDLETGADITDGPLHHWSLIETAYYREPVTATGMLGFWTPPADAIDALRAQRRTRERTGR